MSYEPGTLDGLPINALVRGRAAAVMPSGRIHRAPYANLLRYSHPRGTLVVQQTSRRTLPFGRGVAKIPATIMPVSQANLFAGPCCHEIDDGMGFSLKPPKWLKKAVTLKNVIKVGAIAVAAVVAAPVLAAAAPVLGHAVVGGAKALVSLGSGIAGKLFPSGPAQQIPTGDPGVEVPTQQIPPPPDIPLPNPLPIPAPAPVQLPYYPTPTGPVGTASPTVFTQPTGDTPTEPAPPAAAGGSPINAGLILGGAALAAVVLMQRGRR